MFFNAIKKLLPLLLIAAGAAVVADDKSFYATLEPATVIEGESFQLQLINNGRQMPELQQQLEKFTYRSSGQSRRIVNGAQTCIRSYEYIAPEPGKYTIGPLKVKLGSKIVETTALTLTVVKDSAAGVGSEDIFARINLPLNRDKIYVGEEIPLSVSVYYPRRIRLNLAYPVLDIGKSVFRDFRQINNENPNFARPRQGREVVDDKLFENITFDTAFRPMAAGQLTVSGKVLCQLQIPDRRQEEDDFVFFGGTRYRQVARELTVQSRVLTVEPLPEKPADGLFLGVVGNFAGSAELSARSVKALEPITLNITLLGNSSLETLRPPELALENCRVYPGEIQQNRGGCVISYVIIPLEAGKVNTDLKFYYFDPQAGTYKDITLKETLTVTPAAAGSGSAAKVVADSSAVKPLVDESKEEFSAPRTTLLYCKKSPLSVGARFYQRNRELLAAILLLAGPAIWLVISAIRRSSRRSVDQTQLRRERAGSLRNTLAAELKSAAAEDLPRLATEELTGFLCDRWQLPPGTSINEIAELAHDPELGKALKACADASYLPAELRRSALPDAEKIRSVLLKSVKLLLLTAVLGANWQLSAADKINRNSAEVKDWQSALHAYDRGNYKAAKAYFEKYLQENGSDSHVLYNLGCIAEANGEQEMALWYLESAALADPLDSATFENRNVMRRKFFQPVAGEINSPADILPAWRDRLHPGDYLLLAALVWVIFCLIMSLRHRLSDSWRWSLGGICGGFILILLLAALSLYSSLYSNSRGVVVVKNAELYSFPGVHNGRKSGSLPGGTPLEIIEQQADYSLVRGHDIEGWVSNQAIRKLR